jgi:hypothetical protein
MLRRALPWISLICLVLAIIPATAQNTLYENGPINGEVQAWTINEGFTPSNSFTLTNASTINGLSFGAWLFTGDVLESAQIILSQFAMGSGTVYLNQQVEFAQSGCFANGAMFNVCTEAGSFNGPALEAGTYWLTIGNAIDTAGDPVYWDENNGVGCHSVGCPSEALDSSLGTIPSEAFTLLGSQSGGTGTSPEPISLVLFASGALGVVGWIRRT